MSAAAMNILGIIFTSLSVAGIVINNYVIWAGCIASANVWFMGAHLRRHLEDKR